MNHRQQTILVVDDEAHITELVQYNLEQAGYQIQMASSGTEAFRLLDQIPVDLVILDLMLPDMDGIDLLRQIRASDRLGQLFVIMLTAKSEEVDRVLGLELGADDYLTKPFSIKELVARVKNVLKRRGAAAESEENVLDWHDLRMNLDQYEVTLGNQPVELTHKEFELLKQLLLNRGRVQSRNDLLDAIWGDDYFGETRTVDVHIRNIRRKIGGSGLEELIETVRGVGYKIRG